MGTAVGAGANRALQAAQKAISSPLLEEGSIEGARGILINITGSSSLTLREVQEASALVQEVAHEDANIIFGAVHDEAMKEGVKITVIATGFKDRPARAAAKGFDAAKGKPLGIPATRPLAAPARATSGPPPGAPAPAVPLAVKPATRPSGSALEASLRLLPSDRSNLDVPAFLRRRTGN